MDSRKLAIIGDNFITTTSLKSHLQALGADLDMREKQFPWPDQPMNLVAQHSGLKGLREYMGDPEEVTEFLQGVEMLVNHLAPVSESMLSSLPDLRMIVVTRGGPVNIDAAAVSARGIRLVNTPGRNASAVAEFTVGMMLAETRLIRIGHESLRSGKWRGDLYREDNAGRELGELAVGIVGYGHVGTRVVSLLLAFGATVLVHDPFKSLTDSHEAAGVRMVGLDELLGASDIVSMHSRLQSDGGNVFDRTIFGRMKHGAIFVNTARGVMVDYDDLHLALTGGILMSAALDTYDNEPPEGSPILDLPNVTLTPHLAGSSKHTVQETARRAAEEVRRYLAGEDPLNPIR